MEKVYEAVDMVITLLNGLKLSYAEMMVVAALVNNIIIMDTTLGQQKENDGTKEND